MDSTPFLHFKDTDYADIEFYFFDSSKQKEYIIGKDTDPFMILVAHTEDYQDNYPEEYAPDLIDL